MYKLSISAYTYEKATKCGTAVKKRRRQRKNNYAICSQSNQQILIGSSEWINLCAPLLQHPKSEVTNSVVELEPGDRSSRRALPNTSLVHMCIFVSLYLNRVGVSVETSYHCNQNSLINPVSTQSHSNATWGEILNMQHAYKRPAERDSVSFHTVTCEYDSSFGSAFHSLETVIWHKILGMRSDPAKTSVWPTEGVGGHQFRFINCIFLRFTVFPTDKAHSYYTKITKHLINNYMIEKFFTIYYFF